MRCGPTVNNSIKQIPRRHIGHVGDLLIGQVANMDPGQLISPCCSATEMASPRLETPSLERMLLT
jgi:hypothetical protein